MSERGEGLEGLDTEAGEGGDCCNSMGEGGECCNRFEVDDDPEGWIIGTGGGWGGGGGVGSGCTEHRSASVLTGIAASDQAHAA